MQIYAQIVSRVVEEMNREEAKEQMREGFCKRKVERKAVFRHKKL